MRQYAYAVLALAILFTLPVTAESITGKVEIISKPRKVSRARRAPVRTTSYQQQQDYDSDQTQGEVGGRDETRSVVLSVLNPPKTGVKKSGVMRQKDKAFHPYVLAVVTGSEVEFPNDDTIYHGVYSESQVQAFELPQYANGESRSITFKKPGVVELFCHIHAHMNAYIVVLESSFFDQPDKSHTYNIDDLPPGQYKVKAWHPRLGSKVQMVEVKAGQEARLDFSL